ncbi:MAG TPA: sulfotransferase [Gammaproteobacteria bacterium]|nr:sulfotransferase [Gammaproteobacteria bacterium]
MNLPKRLLNKLSQTFGGTQVRERIVVQQVDSSKRKPLKPGFIVGVYRSGTTLLRFVLDSHPNIAVPPESNFLLGLAELWRNDWYRKGLQGVGVDEEALLLRLREMAGGIFDSYAIAKGKSRWFDKTPSYIDALDFIGPLFGPECRYVMLYRHGFDVAESLARMHGHDVNRGPGRKYAAEHPDSPRLTNARYWAEQCEAMLAFEAAHPQQCFRIFYEQYSSEPERYLPPMFEFLGEPWDPEVLQFADKQHDFGLQDSKILDSKGFSPNIGAHRSWSAEEIALARRLIGPTMEKLGYEI